MAPNTNSKSNSLGKPPVVKRADSAPPTRGREGFDKSMPMPKPSNRPSRLPLPPSGAKAASPPRKALKRPKRMLPRDPMAEFCNLALSRTESVLVSSSGDVMVCRCRRSSTPFVNRHGGAYSEFNLDPWENIIPCCDTPNFIKDGPWSPVFDSLSLHNKISADSATTEGSTYEWEKIEIPKVISPSRSHRKSPSRRGENKSRSAKKGPEKPPRPPASPILSNSPVDTGSPKGNSASQEKTESPKDEGNIAPVSPDFQPPTVETIMDFNAYDGEFLPLPSFDYDHIHNGHNDMLIQPDGEPQTPLDSTPTRSSSQSRQRSASSTNSRRKIQPSFPTIPEAPEEKKDEGLTQGEFSEVTNQPFYHGVPVFLSFLSQVRISKVSAHPLGAHVLLISDEALLFAYGLNNHGQLGIGIQSSLDDSNRGFHTTPTLITPLLENGGKTIQCAAGVDHSLVVVATEGRRLHKLQTKTGVAHSDHGASYDNCGSISPSNSEDQDSVLHHQLYGFGSNDFMKIGLVNARLADDGAEGDGENILLPRRVALHCTVWPQSEVDGTDGSESLPPHGIFDIAASAEHSAALVRRPTGDIEVYMWGNATLGALGLPVAQDPGMKIQGELTQRPLSNANNIFPLPTVLESLTYRPNRDSPLGFPRQVSLGPYCSFVVMSNGKCMSFGFSAEGILGHGFGLTHSMHAKEVSFSKVDPEEGDGIVSVSAGAYHAIGLTQKGHVFSWGINSDDRLGQGSSDYVKVATNPKADATAKENLVVIEWAPQKIEQFCPKIGKKKSDDDSLQCVAVCAGYDSSMVVARSGQVYSFGKRSGRLGQGEVGKDVCIPEPLHGGLRLFHNRKRPEKRYVADKSKPRTKALLKRIVSDGAMPT